MYILLDSPKNTNNLLYESSLCIFNNNVYYSLCLSYIGLVVVIQNIIIVVHQMMLYVKEEEMDHQMSITETFNIPTHKML